jgi:hypothetical protein
LYRICTELPEHTVLCRFPTLHPRAGEFNSADSVWRSMVLPRKAGATGKHDVAVQGHQSNRRAQSRGVLRRLLKNLWDF